MVSLRVPVAEAAGFWAKVPDEARRLGHVPRGMMVRGAIGFAVGALLGGFSSGIGGFLGLGGGLAVTAALLPMLSEVDFLRDLLRLAPGERIDLRPSETGWRIDGEWVAADGTVKRVKGRLQIRVGKALLSLPASSVPLDDLDELLEAA